MASFPYRIRVSPDVISQEVLLGETLLMNVKTLAYFGLDDFGSRIWKEIETCNEAEEVFTRLRAGSDMDEEELARKFNGVLRGLEMSRIISLEQAS